MSRVASHRFLRLELSFSAPFAPGQPSRENVFVDVVLDEQNRVVGKWGLYGRWAEDDGSGIKIYPMIIKLNGEVYFNPVESYSTNLRERTMAKGELCTFWSDDTRGRNGGEEWAYKVQHVIDLAKGE